MQAIFGTSYFRQGGRVARFCPCSVETVQQLNRELITPKLLPLLNRTFFRYAKVPLERSCPFWDDSGGSCALRSCAVEECSEDEVRRLDACDDEHLGTVWHTDVAALGAEAPSWDLGDGSGCALTETCTASWTDDEDGEFVDLNDNPERYTGYAAEAGASRIWHELHAHNSFHSPGCCGEEREADLMAMPVEHRLFYRLLSGLHASVSSHIAANYLIDRKAGTWGLELDEYRRRLGDHPERLHNLHFAYLTVLRAVELASGWLSSSFAYATGMPREDASVAREVRGFLASQPEWPLTFDEHAAFAGVRCPSGVERGREPPRCGVEEVRLRAELLGEFRQRLHNISKLMDCVGCGRCRLWGKLQVQGLGTALRVLYAPDRQAVLASLGRAQVVSLFNLLGRLSHSVEVARVVVPLLGAAHSTCSPRGCKATEYEISDDEISGEDGRAARQPTKPLDPFLSAMMG